MRCIIEPVTAPRPNFGCSITSPILKVFVAAYGWTTCSGACHAIQYIFREAVASLITSQMMLEDAVAKSPLPVVKVNSSANGYMAADVKYVDAETGEPANLNFSVDG